ncbi:MAG: hypothetical protein HY865_23555 [Chloroflexi bacterium]|nr:hypothetical protein [Chloroflexota bacterium]
MKDSEITHELKIATHVVSIFIIPLLFGILALSQNDITKTSVVILGSAAYIFILYSVAGGFNWKLEEISRLRLFLFLALSGLYLGIFLYGVWYVIRKFESDMFNIPFNSIKGRMFSGKWTASNMKQ